MASMNFWPYPVEPWKLIMMTTYPWLPGVGTAKSSGFHLKDQSSPQAPCGPPWIRNFTGYFFEGSKFGGLTKVASTLSLLAPVNQKGSPSDMSICESSCSLMWVRARSLFSEQDSFPGSTSPVFEGHPSPIALAVYISLGAFRDMRLNRSVFPSGVMLTSSL